MNQNPVMQGGNTPDQGNQPVNTNTNSSATSVNSQSANDIQNQMLGNQPVTVSNDGATSEPVNPPKKKRKGLVAAIIVVIVLLLGLGGVAAWYFLYYNNPEKVAYDAINGFLQQKTVVSNGNFIGRTKIDNGEALITVDLNSKSTTTSGDSTATIKVSMLDANGELLSDNQYEVELSGVATSDGVLYFRTGKLMDTVDLLMEDMSITFDDLDASGQTVYKLLNNIDGEWWQIDVADVIDNIVEDSALAHSSKELYSCLVNVAYSDINEEIASIYSQNRFVNITPSSSKSKIKGATDYTVNLDYDKMANFSNSLMESDTTKSAENCIYKYVVEDLGSEVNFENTPADANKIRKSLEGTEFTLSIMDFGHELVGSSISYNQNGAELFGNFGFSHPEVVIEAPEKYRPISDLIDMLVESIVELINGADDDSDIDFIYDEETGEWIVIEDDFNEDDNNYEEV